MAFIETQPVAQASGAVRELYEHQEAYWGFVPNYAKAFSHRPEVLVRWGKLLAELRRPVSDDRFELVTLVAALELRNSACALAHGRVLAELTDKATVLALAEGREAEVLDPADLALVRFVRSLMRDAAAVDLAQIEALRSHGFSDTDLFDVAAIAAGRGFLARLLDGLGVRPDHSHADLDQDLRDALTCGRAIDSDPPVSLSRD